MPTDLPATAIGLIAFVITGASVFIWRVINKFMTYIETKNNNLEKTTIHFTEKLEERDKRFDDMLIKHDERQQQMMDDMAARLEASMPHKKRRL